MITITANDLKKKGISALSGADEACVTVRGKIRYVVMDVTHYESLREMELEKALLQSKQDIKDGKYVIESVAKHIKRITKPTKRAK